MIPAGLNPFGDVFAHFDAQQIDAVLGPGRDVRGEGDVLQRPQRTVGGKRFLFIDVQSGRREATAGEGVDQARSGRSLLLGSC